MKYILLYQRSTTASRECTTAVVMCYSSAPIVTTLKSCHWQNYCTRSKVNTVHNDWVSVLAVFMLSTLPAKNTNAVIQPVLCTCNLLAVKKGAPLCIVYLLYCTCVFSVSEAETTSNSSRFSTVMVTYRLTAYRRLFTELLSHFSWKIPDEAVFA